MKSWGRLGLVLALLAGASGCACLRGEVLLSELVDDHPVEVHPAAPDAGPGEAMALRP